MPKTRESLREETWYSIENSTAGSGDWYVCYNSLDSLQSAQAKMALLHDRAPYLEFRIVRKTITEEVE